MDMFSIHPYPENSSVSPLRRHPHSRSIGVADYDKLVALLERAFGRAMPIVYGELGIETVVPQPERRLYTGTEPASTRPVGGLRQGRDYAQAIELAACQPLVVMILLFHVSDERRLAGLQSGVYYADGTPKASLPIVERTAQAAARGKLQCR